MIPLYGGRHAQLAGDIFAAYLSGSMPASVLSRIIWAVQEHSTHRDIVAFVRTRIEGKVVELRRFLTEMELRDVCAKAIDDFRMPAPGPAGAGDRAMVKPYYSGDLQQIISGIHSIGLKNASYGLAGVGVVEGVYNIKDAYDFDNDRSMFPFYDNYRKTLANYYIEDRDAMINLYSKCVTTYEADMLLAPVRGGSDAVKGPLNRPLIFTAFMYAIEKGGLTNSLFWSADIPFEIDMREPSPAMDQSRLDIREQRPQTKKLADLPGARPIFKFKTLLPPPRTAPVSGPETYTVKAGDNLSLIAKKLYGDARRWQSIYNANKEIIGKNPNLIFARQVLVIPRP